MLGLKQIIKTQSFLDILTKIMELIKLRLSQINGVLHFQVLQSKIINFQAHQIITATFYQIQVQRLFLLIVLVVNSSNNLSWEMLIMELDIQIRLLNMSLQTILLKIYNLKENMQKLSAAY